LPQNLINSPLNFTLIKYYPESLSLIISNIRLEANGGLE